ncbi:MAG: HAMP domain-containing protein [Chloroflexi bacterium]|nr:HAMP domain-containing protein [Chloroflexota bacterium]
MAWGRDVDITSSAFERSSGDSQDFGKKPVPTLNRLIGVFASLRAKLIIPYVILTLLIAMVGVYVITRLVTSSLSERFTNQLLEASRVAGDGIVRKERTHLEDLRLMAFTEGVPEALVARDPQALQDLLFPIALNSGIQATTVVDLTGTEIITLARHPSSGEYIISEGGDFSRFKIVSDILKDDQDGIGDKYAGLLVTSFGPYLFTSAPVRDANGDLLGVMLAGTSLDTLLSDMKNQSLADVILLNNEGKLVSTTFVEPETGFGPVEINPGLINETKQSITLDFDLYGRDYKSTYAPLVIRSVETGILGVALPSNFILTTMATSRTTFSLIFSAGTLATIVVGYLLAQSIAKPILRLRAVSQAVAAGDLNQDTGLRGSDEIGELAGAFDIMTLRLRDRTAEAARLYDETLLRNKELAEINARLQTAQAQLIQSEKLASVGQLTAGIVHDVKNPLAVIKGLAEELSEEFSVDPSMKDQLATIRESATKASTIVTDLLKFARQSTPELEQRDLRETVEASLRLTEYLARKGKVEVKVDMPSSPVLIWYDAQQIEQVLINLLGNAIQAMKNGGTVRINLSKAESSIALSVQDNGVGIPEKNLERIFDPFFTTKPEGEGTGLGLSVSFGIITRHRGQISVDSKPGLGTTFTILLPIDQEQDTGIDEPQGEPDPLREAEQALEAV